MTEQDRVDIANEAKHFLAKELGNQSRFLYEYGYVQIVDMLAEGGFLRTPNTPMQDKQDTQTEARSRNGELALEKASAASLVGDKSAAMNEAQIQAMQDVLRVVRDALKGVSELLAEARQYMPDSPHPKKFHEEDDAEQAIQQINKIIGE